MTDNDEVVLKLIQRDPRQCEVVVKEHTAHLFRASLGMGFNAVEADELVQNVWITFFEILERFEKKSTIRTFLFGILYNKAYEAKRKNKNLEFVGHIEDTVDKYFDDTGHWLQAATPVHPEKFLQSLQTTEILKKCLELLPLNQKMAFVLKEVDDEKSEHICQSLDVSLSNLNVLLFRARQQLRHCIDSKSR